MNPLRWIVLAGVLFAAGPTPSVTPACGLGPPPGSPEFAAYHRTLAEEEQRNGYRRVCDADLTRWKLVDRFDPLSKVLQGLPFQPVALGATPFARMQSLGGMTETMGGPTSRLYRGFRQADGRTVILMEQDTSADGVRMYRSPDDQPERINGLPARLMVFQAPSGDAVSVLSWMEGMRWYELWIDANVVVQGTRAQLFGLARSLPKSVPSNSYRPEVFRDSDGTPIELPFTAAALPPD